jgi:hypothetical protein
MEYPSYLPNLAPNYFWLFSKIMCALNRRGFRNTEGIQINVTTVLKSIPQQAFLKCFQQWQDRWAKCIAAKGKYFEGGPTQ